MSIKYGRCARCKLFYLTDKMEKTRMLLLHLPHLSVREVRGHGGDQAIHRRALQLFPGPCERRGRTRVMKIVQGKTNRSKEKDAYVSVGGAWAVPPPCVYVRIYKEEARVALLLMTVEEAEQLQKDLGTMIKTIRSEKAEK